MKAFDSDRSSAIRVALVDHVAASSRRSGWRPRLLGTALLASGILLGAGTTAAIAMGADREDERVAGSALAMDTFRQLSALPGFVSGGPASSGSDALAIYWFGPLDDASIIAERAASEGVRVRFEPALRAPDELWSDAVTLTDALGSRGIEVTGFGPNREYTGIALMGPHLSVDPDLQKTATDLAADLLGRAIKVRFLPNETGLTFPATIPADD